LIFEEFFWLSLALACVARAARSLKGTVIESTPRRNAVRGILPFKPTNAKSESFVKSSEI
jgi:hypothetical protein